MVAGLTDDDGTADALVGMPVNAQILFGPGPGSARRQVLLVTSDAALAELWHWTACQQPTGTWGSRSGGHTMLWAILGSNQ